MEGAAHILLVEDDPRLAELVRSFLEDEGLRVTLEARGDRALEAVRRARPDLVLLDVMLPGMNGFDVCRALRAELSVPVAMLTAKTEELDEVLGLELGADDYIPKPVRPRALLARIRNLLGRPRRGAPAALQLGPLVVRPARREVEVDGAAVETTSLEFDLLSLLARHAGHVVSRETLYQEIRGATYDGLDRSIDLAISRLRRKLGRPEIIKTVRGSGYLLAGPTA